jgi:hypothetical protein
MHQGICLLIVLLQLVVAYPKSKSDEENKDFVSVFEKKFESQFQTNELQFGSLWQVRIDSYGNLLFLDTKGSQVCVFNKSGKFIKRIGAKGQGPGEYIRPHAMGVDYQGNIYIADHSTRRINIYDRNGEFVSSFLLSGSHWAPDELIVFNSKKNMYVGGFKADMNTPGSGKWINKYDQSGKYISSIVERNAKQTWLLRMFPVFCFDIGPNDLIYAAEINKYSIEVYDSEGNYIDKIGTIPSYFRKPSSASNFDASKYKTVEKLQEALINLSNSWTRITQLEVVEDAILIVMEMNNLVKGINHKYLIDIYDIKGKRLHQGIQTDCKLLCSDKQGNIYFLLHTDEEDAVDTSPKYEIGFFRLKKSS